MEMSKKASIINPNTSLNIITLAVNWLEIFPLRLSQSCRITLLIKYREVLYNVHSIFIEMFCGKCSNISVVYEKL